MLIGIKLLYNKLISKDKGELLFLSTRYSVPFIGIFCNFFVLKYISPSELGVIHTMMLIPTYFGFIHFGVFNGLSRNYAIFQAQRRKNKVQRVVDASWLVGKIISIIGGTVGVVIIIYFVLLDKSSIFIWSTMVVLAMLTFTPLQEINLRIFLSNQSFHRLGILMTIHNVIIFILGILPMFLGVIGLIIRRALDPVIKFFLLLYKTPTRPKAQGEWKEIIELGKVGMPMLITGVIYSYLTIADRSLIAFSLGTTAVGNFALAGIVTMIINFLPSSLGMLLYPKAATAYGQMKSSKALRRYFWIGLTLNVALILPFCFLIYFGISPIVETFFPEYIKGIEAAKISAIGSIFFVFMGIEYIIPIVRRNFLYQIAIGFCLGLTWILGLLFINSGFGIEGVAWARLIGNAILCIFTLFYAYYLTTADIWEE